MWICIMYRFKLSYKFLKADNDQCILWVSFSVCIYQGGPHPGMRAAAEIRKQMAPQQGGGGKGMMGFVLPMYAIGIVLYLLYTLSKV